MNKERIDIRSSHSIWMVIWLLLLGIPYASGQRVIVNSTGEKIIMYPDGSWRMIEIGDSVLLRQSLQVSDIHDTGDAMPPGQEELNTGEAAEYHLRHWNELHFNLKAQEKKVQSEFRAATNAKFSASEQLENALVNKLTIEPDRLAALQDDYNQSIRILKNAKTSLGAIKRLVEMSKKIADLPVDQMEPKLNKLKTKYKVYLANHDPGRYVPDPVAEDREIASPDKKNKPPESPVAADKNNSGYATPVSEKLNSEYRSEPIICHVLRDTLDEVTGRRRIELAAALMFTHTDPDLRPYFKNKELITCYGKLSRIDAYAYLSIEFQIASSHSQSNFGSLQSGSLLRMKLLNGEYVSLYSIKSDRGRIDPYSGYTIFTGQYALGKNEIKQLKSSALDKVRILWSTGYEDYDVYKIDFFRDQLECLMNR